MALAMAATAAAIPAVVVFQLMFYMGFVFT
jgi:hypothetical protein